VRERNEEKEKRRERGCIRISLTGHFASIIFGADK